MGKCKDAGINIAICTSGIGLGFYVPGIVLCNKIAKLEIGRANVFVYEDLLTTEKQQDIPEIKKVFQQNFKVALLSQRVVGATGRGVDDAKKEQWIETLIKDKVTRIICFSGFWLPLIAEYTKRYPHVIVDMCHVDCVHSTSWLQFKNDEKNFRDIFFNNWESKSTDYFIPFSEQPIIPFSERELSLVIHGGGWGLGEFREVALEIESHHFSTHIITNQESTFTSNKVRNLYMIDPKWNAWTKDEHGYYTLPPLSKLQEDGTWLCKQSSKIQKFSPENAEFFGVNFLL